MARATTERGQDPRIHVTADHLRRLGPKARSLSFLPRQPAASVLNGRHASLLRGRGLNFEELRGYVDGDDVRSIDWKVTARTGKPHIRVYSEERDRPTLLVVDQRMSMFFGSTAYMKSVVAAEATALAAHRVLAQGDRVGGLVFGDRQLSEHRPQRSRAALNRFLNALANANGLLDARAPNAPAMPLNTVLQAALRIARKNAAVMVFSDFDEIDETTEHLVAALARANDLILFHVLDPLSNHLPEDMRLTISDGHLQAEIDTSNARQRDRLKDFLRDRMSNVYRWGRSYGFPVLPLTTERSALEQVLDLLGHPGGRR